MDIQHEPDEQTFYATLDDTDIGELSYSLPERGVIDFSHTYVEEEHRSKGVAVKLVEAGLAYAEQENMKIIASCAVVARYVDTHPDYKKMLWQPR